MSRILLVDDEENIAILTKRILEKEGHQVIVAENGKKCMKVLDRERPDLILMDVMMPGNNGWEVCRKIKRNEKTKDVPVVMFTVRTSENSVEKSLEYADAQIDKPFKMKELLSVVDGLLRG